VSTATLITESLFDYYKTKSYGEICDFLLDSTLHCRFKGGICEIPLDLTLLCLKEAGPCDFLLKNPLSEKGGIICAKATVLSSAQCFMISVEALMR
jgi:hypothetical protein